VIAARGELQHHHHNHHSDKGNCHCKKTTVDVVVKLQPTEQHLRELHALYKLRGVRGVVDVLDVVRCDQGLGLVLPLLREVPYDAIKKDLDKVGQFVVGGGSIVEDVHDLGLTHMDLKPGSFMLRLDSDELILIDFNLADVAARKINSFDDLCGTPGWVLHGTPWRTPADVDRVAFASVIFWLLGLPYFGESDYAYHWAMLDASAAVETASCQAREQDARLGLLLSSAQALLGLSVTFADLVASCRRQWTNNDDGDDDTSIATAAPAATIITTVPAATDERGVAASTNDAAPTASCAAAVDQVDGDASTATADAAGNGTAGTTATTPAVAPSSSCRRTSTVRS
jgi:hypothetical protein